MEKCFRDTHFLWYLFYSLRWVCFFGFKYKIFSSRCILIFNPHFRTSLHNCYGPLRHYVSQILTVVRVLQKQVLPFRNFIICLYIRSSIKIFNFFFYCQLRTKFSKYSYSHSVLYFRDHFSCCQKTIYSTGWKKCYSKKTGNCCHFSVVSGCKFCKYRQHYQCSASYLHLIAAISRANLRLCCRS